MSDVVFRYGTYDFDPMPLFKIEATPIKTLDGVGYGREYTISMDGYVLLMGDEISSGTVGVFNEVESLKNALNHDGRLLVVSCNGSPIISGYPLIESFDVQNSNDNYTRKADYNITFVMPTTIQGTGNDVFNDSTFPPFIRSCKESWDVEFADERLPFEWVVNGTTEKFGYKLAVTHTVDVEARIVYTGSEISNVPWEDAKEYATSKLGFNGDFATLSGIINMPGGSQFSSYGVFNQYRQVSTNKTDGSIQVVETFIVTPSGTNSLPNNAIETFDISLNRNDGITSVSIQGQIEGLASIAYTGNNFYVSQSKYSAASGYFNVIKDRIYDRAKLVHSGLSDDCYYRQLNPTVTNRTIGHNPLNGTISYSYEYDTAPISCITGSCILSQSISIDDQLATDVFASQVVLGRAMGPILQDIGTKTARTRTVSVELVTLTPTGCGSMSALYSPVPTGLVEGFISMISGDLTSNYSQVFVSSNTQNWNFSVGRYSRSIGFTYTNCSG